MKKFFRFAVAALGLGTLLAAPAQAQIYPVGNGDFETWSQRGAAQAPNNWQTTDDLYGTLSPVPLPFSLGTVTRTTDKHAGSYAAKLETVANALIGDTIPGLLILGNRIGNLFSGLPGGAPFTARPQYLQFYYKLTGANAASDSATAVVILTHSVNGNPEPVGFGQAVLAPSNTYRGASVAIQYVAPDMPDSLRVFFSSAGGGTPHPGTALYVDDVVLSDNILSTHEQQLATELRVFPNPSTTGTFELSAAEPALLAAPLTVLDATGRVVLHQAAAPAAAWRRLELGRQPAGIYTLQLHAAQGTVTRKLVIH